MTSDNHNQSDQDISLLDLIEVIWEGRKLLLATMSIVFTAAIFITLLMTNIYKSEVLLAPSEDISSNDPISTYSELASVAGIDLGGSVNSPGENKILEGIEILKSRKFVTDFIQKRDLLPVLMAAKNWDASNKKLILDHRKYDSKKAIWKDSFFYSKPSMQKAYQKFMDDNLSINRDKKTGFIKLSISHVSPVHSKNLVDWYIEDLNEVMKLEVINQAESSISYLDEQLSKTTDNALQQVFYRLIQEQTKTIMLAKGRKEYLFKTLDPAIIPERKFSPARTLIVIISTIISFMFAAVYLLLNHYFFKKNSFQ